MEPQIRYARTSDGVNIAWYSVGEGYPWLWPSVPPSHVAEQWRMPELRGALELWPERGARLIGCDFRGFGLSDRGPMDHSLDAMVRDLEAVVDAAGLDRTFILQAYSYATIPVLAYAARHPEQVRGLVLQNGLARGSDLAPSWRRLVRLAAEDWDEAKLLMGRTNDAGWAMSIMSLEQSRRMLDLACTQDEFLRFASALETWDVSEELSQVRAPALVLHYGLPSHTPLDASRRLAAALQGGSFLPVDRPLGGGMAEVLLPVYDRFLSEVFHRPARPPQSAPSTSTGMSVIIFADIADSTALTERLGDAAFREKARALDDALRSAITASGGQAIEGKLLGDGVLATFGAAREAIACAGRLHDEARRLGLSLHVGLHAGDVIREANNVWGGAVNIAARISAASAPGETLVSQTVRDLGRTSAGVAFEDRGDRDLKGVTDPVRVYAVT